MINTDDYAFDKGHPTCPTAERAYDDADLARAVGAYKFFYPTVSGAAIVKGNSQIQTEQNKAALRSLFELKDHSGSATELFFGPAAPAGNEGQWIQTIQGKSWFAYFRIYGPQSPAFDGTWKPGDFELLTDSS